MARLARSWTLATDSPTIVDDYFLRLTWCDPYWLVTERSGAIGAATIGIHYATDPSGTWSTGTVAGSAHYDNGRVVSDGTTFACSDNTGVDNDPAKSPGVLHTTDPSGTWSKVAVATVDAVDDYTVVDLAYGNGTWVACGDHYDSSVPSTVAFVAYATAVTGTWTVVDDVTAGGMSFAWSIAYGDGTWALIGSDSAAPSAQQFTAYTASTPGGTWSVASSIPTHYNGGFTPLLKYANGVFAFTNDLADTVYPVVTPVNRVLYATDPTGTWSVVEEADLGFSQAAGNQVRDIAYIGSAWMVCATIGDGVSSSIRYRIGATPAGAYRPINDPDVVGLFSEAIAGSPDYGVLGAYDATDGIYTAPLTAFNTYLRQRQSPVRSPSRVSGVNLRNRQTPIIAK